MKSNEPASSTNRITNLISRILPRREIKTRQELSQLLDEASDIGRVFNPSERSMLRNVLAMRELRVHDIMVPRADIEAVDLMASVKDMITLFKDVGHSRLPVYSETLDDVSGMIHVKDIMALITDESTKKDHETIQTIAELLDNTAHRLILRPILFVPPSMLASDLLGKMQATRIHIAMVIDEYGGTDGLVTIEDLIETIVGDIEDEHDLQDEPNIKSLNAKVSVADARTQMEDVFEHLGERFECGDVLDEIDTLGGLIFSLVGRIPSRGELITSISGYELEILDADPRRIKMVKIHKKDKK